MSAPHPVLMRLRLQPALAACTLAAALSLPAATPAVAQQPAPPAAPVRNADETFFGTTVPDPYRDLEDLNAPATQAWMRAQAAHTQAMLERIPGRAVMLQRYRSDDQDAGAQAVQVQRETGERWFYEKRGAGDNQFKLVLRDGLAGPERVLVDPQAVARATGTPHAVSWYAAAPGGRALAYGLAAQGSEDAVLHVLGTRSGRELVVPVSRAEMGGVSWAPDGRSFVFTRLQELKPGMPVEEKYANAQCLLMRTGQQAAQALPVFGRGVAGLQLAPLEIPFLQLTPDGRWALGFAVNGVARELRVYVSPQAAVLAGRPQWRELVTTADQVAMTAYANDSLVLLSERAAPRGQLLRLDLRDGAATAAQAAVLLPQAPQRVLLGVAAAADALYVHAREGNVHKLFKRAWAGAEAPLQEVALPVAGSFKLVDFDSSATPTDLRLPGAVIELQGWTQARRILQVLPDGRVQDTGLQAVPARGQRNDVVATEVLVSSHDGARVPLSILHRRDVQLNGANPTILYGYGAYGATQEPGFQPERLAWLDAGGVFAVVNPRGSGVLGQDWYRAGWQQTKPNTWKDTLAAAQWLVDAGWTNPRQLGVWGRSAGGVLAGRALTERPELFGAAVIQVGVLDGVRAELGANGAPNVPEFGSRATEAGFRSLLAMSTYHQVRDGVKYPAVLLEHGVHDPRVDAWHSLKTAARLQAVNAGPGGSGAPVLLRLDWDAGHGVGNTKAQQMAVQADVYAFFGWRLGLAGFTPVPR